VKLLLDSRILLLAKGEPERLSPGGRMLLTDPVASLWEVAIKSGRQRDHFRVDTGFMRRLLLEDGYEELPITGEHAVTVASLPRSTRTRSTGCWWRRRRSNGSCS
jgi:PIN domain nuclease of toxin-antitoxin system